MSKWEREVEYYLLVVYIDRNNIFWKTPANVDLILI